MKVVKMTDGWATLELSDTLQEGIKQRVHSVCYVHRLKLEIRKSFIVFRYFI